MTLIDAFKERCVLMEKTRVSDGEGGWLPSWAEGLEFEAAIVLESNINARIAEAEGVTGVYTVTTERNVQMDFHDAFKRLSDGAIFRLTSNTKDATAPAMSTVPIAKATAERWALT